MWEEIMWSDDTQIENLATIQSDICGANPTLPTHDQKTPDLMWYQQTFYQHRLDIWKN